MRLRYSMRMLLGSVAIWALCLPVLVRAAEQPAGEVDLMARLESVCNDLKLTGDVKAKVDAILTRAIDDASKARKEAAGNPRAAFAKSSEAMRAATVEIMAVLDDDQKLLFQGKMRAAAATPAALDAGDENEPRPLPIGQRIQLAVAPLKLSDEQDKKVEALIEDLQTKIREIRAGGAKAGGLGDKMLTIRQDLMERMKEILGDEKFARFRENIARPQNAGTGQGALGARLITTLKGMQEAAGRVGLSDTQQTRLDAAFASARKKFADLSPELQGGPTPQLREKVGVVYDELRTELQAVLTPDQREKFKVSMRQSFGEPHTGDTKKDGVKEQ